MKIWRKTIRGILILGIIIGAVWTQRQEGKVCCVCNSFRYHAPCLVDLETGKLRELDLYYPHETIVAEIADPQPEMGTFSHIKLGNAKGIRLTDSKRIEIEIPSSEVTVTPALCWNCRKQIAGLFPERYILADLYNVDKKKCIQLKSNLAIELRCYKITVQEIERTWKVLIQGTLE